LDVTGRETKCGSEYTSEQEKEKSGGIEGGGVKVFKWASNRDGKWGTQNGLSRGARNSTDEVEVRGNW